MASLRIDVVSDVVCPWCLIGKRRLERALAARPEVEATVVYHPFQLDPSTPAEGADLREHLRRKYGDPEPMFRRVEAVAREDGIALDFSKVRRSVNTLRAHTLARHALARGTQLAVVDALFLAYFVEGRDVGALDTLVAVGEANGFTRAEVERICESPEELAATRREAAELARQGVSGVPFTIVGEKVAISGAQPVAVFEQAIARALAG
jgi:predicted DsbA family dithiol-disulfide isomerase